MCVCVLLMQHLEAHARTALSLPSQSVSKSITVVSAMPGIFCAVGDAKVYCFGVVCDEPHSSAQQGWCLPYHAQILYKYIRSRVTACNVPRATKYSSGCKASACQAGYRVRNGKCAGAITFAGRDVMIATNHAAQRGLCL